MTFGKCPFHLFVHDVLMRPLLSLLSVAVINNVHYLTLMSIHPSLNLMTKLSCNESQNSLVLSRKWRAQLHIHLGGLLLNARLMSHVDKCEANVPAPPTLPTAFKNVAWTCEENHDSLHLDSKSMLSWQ